MARRLNPESDGLRRGSDVATVTVSAAMVVFWFLDPEPAPDYDSPAYVVLSLSLGVACTLALWWRRRCAVPMATVLIVLSVFFGVVAGPSLVALFTVAGYRSLRSTVAVTVLALATVPLQTLVGTPLSGDDRLIGIALLCAVILLAVGWALALKSRRELVDSLRKRAALLVRERALMDDQVRLAEREVIAGTLHDSLAHQLTLISMTAGTLRYRRDELPEELSDLVESLQDQSTTALDGLRAALTDLRALHTPEDADTVHAANDLSGSIRALVQDVRTAGQQVEFSSDVDPGLSAGLASITFRAVREFLTNARKHSPGASVVLSVQANPREGVLVTCSNPCTPSYRHIGADGPGTGLSGIADRVRCYGGRIRTSRTAEDFPATFTVRFGAPWQV